MTEDLREVAIKKLEFFINNGLSKYSSQRNYDFGPDKRSNVSNLSPFIKKRIIHEREVLKNCLKNNRYENIEKFIQEVFWRSYWKGWLEGRKEIWKKYKDELIELGQLYSFGVRKKNLQNALDGKTGIDCFDFWVNELIQQGYLHNHSRMWFASIWIHTLKLPWQLGAEFFLKNLLDGDPASNTLSWRWVAGLHTQGKNYLATENNINKFTNNRFKQKKNLSSKPLDFEYEFFSHKLEEFNVKNYKLENKAFLINLNQISYEKETLNVLSNNNVCVVKSIFENKSSNLVSSFNHQAINDYVKTLDKNNIIINSFNNLSDFHDYLKKNNHREIYTFYPGVGRQNDIIESFSNKYSYKINYQYDKYDMQCWPYASSGFFKFKKKIPFFLEKIICD